MLRCHLTLLFGILLCTCARAQDFWSDRHFTEADTLRGMLTPARTNYDVTYYELHLDVAPVDHLIEGRVEMDYTITGELPLLQLDLYRNLQIDGIEQNGTDLRFTRRGNAVFVELPHPVDIGSRHRMTIHYGGTPTEAQNAPWDGGFVWALDQKNRYWVGVACEGDGASLWWPNKDHLSDEPDSMLISVTVPDRLFVASNGNLRAEVELEDEGKKRYDWFVSYPINNYNVSLGIGHYVHFDTVYRSFDGEELALDYYVMDYNLEKARKQFREVHPMLEAYEHYFGKYPFWDDGFALIEVPYLGMEHQSGIAYGNRYMRGYLGGLIPSDMDWDYIIVHEAGHEYFGNSVSVADHAEMWVHESFTTYMEALYVEFHFGAEAARRYLQSQRRFITNEEPMLGPLEVNFTDFASSDHYYKGAWMLHTLRGVLNDDPLFFGLLRSFYQDHVRSTVNTQQVIDYFSRFTERDLQPFFDQYLKYPAVPVLELRRNGQQTEYRLRADVAGLSMPVGVYIGEEPVRLLTTAEWQPLGRGIDPETVRVDDARFLVDLRVLNEPEK
ncbi:M1 family metallopeptidase [Neolewinella litorea]|uniref:M1 family peptidase n=1 Tax=Neolewinella litorea TaxID=2562452 RepID=A0A4S4NKQ3_9BACT|nr:M1 family metallopeptidase [Neolewinella litorea]THH40476.1 M1 family peptidase [Neolewinella litorea]